MFDFAQLTLLMTFGGGPFILLLVWIAKKFVFNDEKASKPVETKNGQGILIKMKDLEKEVHQLGKDMVKLEEKQNSVTRELTSLHNAIVAMHKRLDEFLKELATKDH